MPSHYPSIPLNSGDFSRLPLNYRTRLNREFNFNYQGIVIVYLGKLWLISRALESIKPMYWLGSAKFTSIIHSSEGLLA